MDLDRRSLPRHVAIIMDGNGRWAERRGEKRIRGHESGVTSIRAVTEECARLGLERLTLYSFSVENWTRPRPEVLFLMRLLKRYLIEERETLLKNNVRMTMIGRRDDLPGPVRRELTRTEEISASHTGLNLCLALSYGGRTEIVDAAKAIAADVKAGKLREKDIDEKEFARRLYQPGTDPDLLIRTAGEFRVSNFLLWQISYSEFVIRDECWPDFGIEQLHESLHEYARRTRKFGGLVSSTGTAKPTGSTGR